MNTSAVTTIRELHGRRPNFFIVGAPKCGTTSLVKWLSHHPAVFMCEPKEPYFFCRDLRVARAAENWRDYERLFAGVRSTHLAVGEASTTYLRSRAAVPEILERLPASRFIVCVRNPVDMAVSVHAQLVRGGRENVRDFGEAWALQDARRAGKSLPLLAKNPGDLLYTEVCALGTQLSRLLERVDRARVMIIFLDDLREDPGVVWSALQGFLGIPDIGCIAFTKENARCIPRSIFISRAVGFGHRIKQWLAPDRSLGVGTWLAPALVRVPSLTELAMPSRVRSEITLQFAEEVSLLQTLTGRDLTAWFK